MFLTRFKINIARRGARKLLASPHAMHAAVLAAFPEPSTPRDGGGRVLWRVDQAPNARASLYIVSPAEPDLTHMVEQAGWPTTETWQTRPYGDLLASLDHRQEWAFRLTANPVRSGRRSAASARTQRLGHVTVEQQRDWLLSRAKDAGFRVTNGVGGEADVIVHSRSTYRFKRRAGHVTIRVATYDGRLEVEDPDALRRTLTSGLGHAKAYGCGLLTLAPVARLDG